MKKITSSKIVAAITVVIFFWTSTIGSAQSTSSSLPTIQSIVSKYDEIHLPLIADDLSIPEGVGSIRERYAPDKAAKSDNASSLAFVAHIQDAHANYEAQVNMKKVLQYALEKYGIDSIFLEGAAGDINPDLLKFFKSTRQNQEFADRLMEDGLAGGGEVFILEDSLGKNSSVHGYGVEDIELYRKNLEAYQSVYEKKVLAEKFIKILKSKILSEKSRVFNKKLSDFFKEWLFYEDSRTNLFTHLKTLEKYAKRELELNFSDARLQIEWPNLVRVAKLEELEGEIKGLDLESEKARFIEWTKTEKIDQEVLQPIYQILESKKELAGKIDPRKALERFYVLVSKKGFSFNVTCEV